uniref:Uncharacterized protein n=1 Tax=Acrobeloides nanus TaxID=290746 RepID=A0A914E419_9BILA
MCKITISLFLVAILVNLIYSKIENTAKLGDILLKRQLRQVVSGCSSGSTQSGAGSLDTGTSGSGCAEGNVATQSGSGTGQGSVAGVPVANGAGDSNSGGKFYVLGQTVVNK